MAKNVLKELQNAVQIVLKFTGYQTVVLLKKTVSYQIGGNQTINSNNFIDCVKYFKIRILFKIL